MERMSWLSKLHPRGGGQRAPRSASLQPPVTADPETCLMVFKNHWAQVLRILERRGCKPAPDDLSAVRNHTYQMLSLLAEERPRHGAEAAARGPILDFVASENLLERLLCWHLQGDFGEERKVEQLKLYEMLISQARQPLLRHRPVLAPLLRLLGLCAGPASAPLGNSLVLLLNQLCVSVAKEPSILELFFHSQAEQGPANLIIFSLLIPFIHHEGVLGQRARDALLLIMAMSATNHAVAKSITDNSYFCPVLATGLSALYSSLPRKIEVRGDDWHCLRREDWIGVSSLVLFMNSLEFCNAVIQVAHPLVQKQLVDYVHNGFLVPVMGPALHKSSVEEMIASTAYLELFLRSVSEAALLKTFLRFVLLHRHDSSTILDTLVARINSTSRLCMVSLSLFRTLLSLNCEDVMLQLVLRYLLPCSHVMLSQRRAVRELDIYGRTAAKFLSLTPRCCRPQSPPRPPEREEEQPAWARGSPGADPPSKPSTPSRLSFFLRQPSAPPAAAEGPGPAPRSPGTPAGSPRAGGRWEELRELDRNYLEYLRDARRSIDRCAWACRVWSAPYDGQQPTPLPPPAPRRSPPPGPGTPRPAAAPPQPDGTPPPDPGTPHPTAAPLPSPGPPHSTAAPLPSPGPPHPTAAPPQPDGTPPPGPGTPHPTAAPLPSPDPPHPTAAPLPSPGPPHPTAAPLPSPDPPHPTAALPPGPNTPHPTAAPLPSPDPPHPTAAPLPSPDPPHPTAALPPGPNTPHPTAAPLPSPGPPHPTAAPLPSPGPPHSTAAPLPSPGPPHPTAAPLPSPDPLHSTAAPFPSPDPPHPTTAPPEPDGSPPPGSETLHPTAAPLPSPDPPHPTAAPPQPDGSPPPRPNPPFPTAAPLPSLDPPCPAAGPPPGPTAPRSPRTKKRGPPEEGGREGRGGSPKAEPRAGGPAAAPRDAGGLVNGAHPPAQPRGDAAVRKVRRGPGGSPEPAQNGAAAPQPPPGWEPLDSLLEELLARAPGEPNGAGLTIETFTQELRDLEAEMRNGGAPPAPPQPPEPAPARREQEEEEEEEEEEEDEAFAALAEGGDVPGRPRPPDPLAQLVASPPRAVGAPPSQPFTGPFVSVLLGKLENMLHNSLYVNFLLTGLVAQLACYPQPLLRSFLLNTNMVFQPSVKSLLQVLGSVKNKIESFAASQEDFPALLLKAKKYLIARGKLDWGDTPGALPSLRRSDALVRSRKPSLGELLLRHASSPTRGRHGPPPGLPPARDGGLQPAPGGPGERQSEALRVKNAVYCAVIFSEFLKELAAIAQAHAVTSPFLTQPPED